MPAIDAQHISKSFGSVHALRDVSLNVPQGSVFGFLGPNGSGKTTMLRGLMGLMRFDGGSATLLGLDPWRDRVRLHARLGYLPSGSGVYARMTGLQMLDYVASLATGAGTKSPMRAQVLDALRLSASDLERPVHDYSKGMRQKLAIVQAMQHDPELLLMDEPSEGLDPLVQHSIYAYMTERALQGRTILFSSHTLSEVEALCDRVAIIRDGTLVIAATLDELRATRPRVVRIATGDPEGFAHFPTSFERQDDDHAARAVFHVRATPDEIVGALAQVHLDDLIIEEPSLDHIFRSYYASDTGGQA